MPLALTGVEGLNSLTLTDFMGNYPNLEVINFEEDVCIKLCVIHSDEVVKI